MTGSSVPAEAGVAIVLMVHLYKTGFFYFQMGPAAAIGVIIFIIVMALTIAVLATFRKQVEY